MQVLAVGVEGSEEVRGVHFTLHHTPYTRLPTPYTLHPTLNTLHPTPFVLAVGVEGSEEVGGVHAEEGREVRQPRGDERNGRHLAWD